jgi:large subunit ribosomal protein L25
MRRRGATPVAARRRGSQKKMKTAQIKGEPRQTGGKHANERLRNRGMLPAIVYGHQEAPVTIALSLHDTEIALAQTAHLVEVEIDGKAEQYLIKDVQYDHLQKDPIHLDLVRISVDERVQVNVAVELRGTPAGAKEGGVLTQNLNEIECECLAIDIPERLRIKVDHLNIGDSVHVRDLVVPENVTILTDPEEAIASLTPPRELPEAEEEVVAEEGAEGAEPEVIRKGKEEEGAES